MATCNVCGGAMLTERPHRHSTDPKRTAALAEVEAALRDVETLLHPGPARILRAEIARLREALEAALLGLTSMEYGKAMTHGEIANVLRAALEEGK